jgi:hypothetical protein
MLAFGKTTILAFSGISTGVAILACQIEGAGNGSPNTLASYDPTLVKTIDATSLLGLSDYAWTSR